MTLAYPGGSASVRCSACGAVTRCAERATPSTTGEGSSVKSARGGDHATLTSDNLVVVENPPKLGKGGDVTENISLGSRDACGEIETSAVALEVADIEEEVVEEASEDAPEMASGGDIEMGEATSERAE